MKRRWMAVAVVVVALAALIVYKEAIHTDASQSAAPRAVVEAPSVVLVADPREAESACGCGEIIRMVRSASTDGVAVLEVPPGSSESREYRATVNPTVLFLDQAGAVTSRYEGEEPETITEIRERLEQARRR